MSIAPGVRSTLVNPLTSRQCECLSLAADGKTSAEISIILGIAYHTVGNHFREIQKRLDARTRAHCVAIALRAGWI
ncbi:helix-turn-helix transcriptional regulator [Aurantimonas sp. Leaf443]|uniref:response regulator transcription factor n=1 Tax=Aurantimonas sp. Leaf443 TaxID=1736378 RepID=UPI00138F6DFA|nr:helix-turn-helix transcriptional regulator [Aurantimonas sp. Leaf443]